MAPPSSSSRDLYLVVLAGVVAVVAMACTTYLASRGKIPAEAAAGIIGTSGGTLAGFAIGRMSGANGERDAAPPLPSRTP